MIPRPRGTAFQRAGAMLAIAAMGAFSAGVLWFHGFPIVLVKVMLSLGMLALTAWAVWTTWWAFDGTRLALYAAIFAVCAITLARVEPRNDRIWSPEMAAALTYSRSGEAIIVRNVRNFEWTSLTQSAERWETRSYDLSRLRSLDIASLTWKGPYLAHTYFSFIWADGEALSLSVEIRKEKGEAYSELGGLFRAYEVAIVAGDERDFYGWRVHAPGEDIQLFRTRATPDQARRLLLELLDRANALAERPEFYNTVTNNCSTEVGQLLESLGARGGGDWRTYATGYVPDLLYERGIFDTSIPLEELRARGRILPAAQNAIAQGLTGPDFSRAIRAQVPGAAPAN